MKKIFLIAGLVFMAFQLSAQDSWKLKQAGKVLLSANAENETANTTKIKRTAFDKSGTLDILYKDSKPAAEWKRTLLFFDENDNELLRKDSITATTKINNSTLKELFTGKKKIRIYTISLPTDPNKAAAIRVRRVHLCTLELL
ncbi:MAG TPA: hypothetical protein VF476_15470 [Chitinophagaceae bacterium]